MKLMSVVSEIRFKPDYTVWVALGCYVSIRSDILTSFLRRPGDDVRSMIVEEVRE